MPPLSDNPYLGQRQASTDLTFITNEPNRTLLDRFKMLIKDTRLFDVLIGYFYTSGFYALAESLSATERIRILIGIGTNPVTANLIAEAKNNIPQRLQLSHKETKEEFAKALKLEIEAPADDRIVETGARKFVEWLRSGKLEIRAYPSANIHAKLYIMTFSEGDRDVGRVITGSSNFSQAGLVDNLEFNVELKNRADYEFALRKFNELWEKSVDVKQTYIDTIEKQTWLCDTITPYELYLKTLYEYFRDELDQPTELFQDYRPPGFLDLEYQRQAVLNAKRILEEYGGVIIADVVGLGKTYIAAMLASELPGRSLVIAPPALLDENNPGSWPEVFRGFGVRGPRFVSIGKLEEAVNEDPKTYPNVFIDEAHRFRTEDTLSYEQLSLICRGRKVVLVTATPYNNRPRDILAMLKLFQKARRSTIPNLPNLEGFFNRLEQRLRGLDRQTEYDRYVQVVKENAQEVREKVLRYLTVRRTRTEIERYFSEDLKQRGLRFPEVKDPVPVFYQLNETENTAFNNTLRRLVRDLKYARYTPLSYYTGDVTQIERLSEKNLSTIMRILLVKRLESSFYAFRLTIDRFIRSYRLFIQAFDQGNVYVSKKHFSKVFELLEQDDIEGIERLIEEGRVERYPADSFSPNFRQDLASDLQILEDIAQTWAGIERDPKWLAFNELLDSDPVLQNSKLIIFTESKETADYLSNKLGEKYPGKVLKFYGSAGAALKAKVTANFDARARNPSDEYRILVSTEVLGEGVNLHRANVVISYDIPWNPTRLMQRVGRVNRVDTKHAAIYTYNFFPTEQSNDEIKLRETAQAKIAGFISMLGADSRLLTEGEEITSYELFNRLLSKQTLTGEDPQAKSELKYLQLIKSIRNTQPDLFERIKRLPKKARTGRQSNSLAPALITFFRKGKLTKFFQVEPGKEPQELDFLTAAERLEATETEPRIPPGPDYHDLLESNKSAFAAATAEESIERNPPGSRDAATRILHILKVPEIRNYQGYTEDSEAYLLQVKKELEEGGIPKRTCSRLLRALQEELKTGRDPQKVLTILKHHIPPEHLRERYGQTTAQTAGPREVILSEYHHPA
ncbi:MAG: helicase-related protein [candidate division WOR-3 bacterium]